MLKKILKQKINPSSANWRRRSQWLIVGVMILSLVLFFNVHYADASWIEGVGEAVIYTIVGFVTQILAIVVGKLLNVITYALFWVANLDNFVDNGVVQLGWPVVRDLCNMFFILILLVIAFATILRLENYSVKKLLPKLIIMAVLINFSKTICGLLIDFSQVIMLTFMHSLGHAEGNLYQALGLSKLFTFSDYNLAKEDVTFLSLIISLILGLILLIISGIVITIFTVILFFRMVALWILIILSPLAFIASVLPSTSKYFSQWLSQFTNYLIVGPVLAFFLWLALATVGQVQFEKEFQPPSSESTTKSTISAALTEAGSVDNMTKFIVSICLLLGGLMAAQQLGVAGGKAAGGALGWLRTKGTAPVRGLGALSERVAHFGVRKLDETQMGIQKFFGKRIWKEKYKGPLTLRPALWKEAWEARRQRIEKHAEAVPKGRAQDLLERTLGGRKTDFARTRHQQVLTERKKEMEEGGLETNQLLARLHDALKRKDKYDIEAATLLLTRGQDLNEVFKDERLQDIFQKDFGRKMDSTPQDVQEFTKKYIGGDRGAQLASSIGYEAYDKGDVHMYGMAAVNTRTGRFEYTTPGVQKFMQAQYRMKKEPQVDTRTTRAQAMFNEGIITAVDDVDKNLKTKLKDEKGKDIKVDESNYFGAYTERDEEGKVVGKERQEAIKIQGEWRIIHDVKKDEKTGRITEATLGDKVKQPSNVMVETGLSRELSEQGKEQLMLITQSHIGQINRTRAETAQWWGKKNRLESMMKFALTKEVGDKGGKERQKLILDYAANIAAQAGTYDDYRKLEEELLIKGGHEDLKPEIPKDAGKKGKGTVPPPEKPEKKTKEEEEGGRPRFEGELL